MRLQNITNKGITLVDDEKLRDTLIDLLIMLEWQQCF